MRKKQRNRKRVIIYTRGRFLYSCVLLRFGNTLGCPSLRRRQSYENLPYNISVFDKWEAEEGGNDE
jgi:hypothetical protein